MTETDYTQFPTCPYCGIEEQDYWECTNMKFDGDEETRECIECDKEYRVYINLEVTFCSRKFDER